MRGESPEQGLDAVVGRGSELALGARFLDERDGPRALVIEGEVGIGKTTVWRELLSVARVAGFCVLSASPTVPEEELAFSALGDLLAPVVEEALPSLSAARRAALEQALWLGQAEPAISPDPRAIGLGVLDVLRGLASRGPLAVAVDDEQWLDRASAAALMFSLRRVGDAPIVLLLARRTPDAEASAVSVALAIDPTRVEVLELGPLSVGAIGRVLRARLEETLSRPNVRRAHEISGGNPLFAIELAGSLRRHRSGLPDAPPELPLTLRGLVDERVAELSLPARRVALAASALAHPRVETVLRAVEANAQAGLDDAIDAGVLIVDGGRVRFTHPLLASAVYREATTTDRRLLHGRLAEVVNDVEERARHLIVVTAGPDAAVAGVVEEAALQARARGAPQVAAELSERAVALTPDSALGDRARRLMVAGQFWFAAGESRLAVELLDLAVETAPPGTPRVEALLAVVRARSDRSPVSDVLAAAKRALAESAGDPLLEARALAALAEANFENFDQALADGQAALARLKEARRPDARTEASALKAVAMAEFYSGRGLNLKALERARALERQCPEPQVHWRAESLMGDLLERACRFEEARPLLERSHRAAVEEGDEGAVPDTATWLAELELVVGRWAEAREWVEVVADAAERSGQVVWEATAEGMRARLFAHTGQVEAARAAAGRSLALVGLEIPADHALAALGVLELSLGNLDAAEHELARLDTLAQEVRLREPAGWKYEADRIEALIGLARLKPAGELLERLESRASALEPSWARATAGRCRGLLAAAHGTLDDALAALRTAMDEHERLAMPFERARTLLVLGEAERRVKKRRAARETLQRALMLFEQLGAPIWADKARAELARIGGRAPSTGGLTTTEERIAQLVAAGRSNKQIAAELFISVHTVEANLTRIYAKLGVRSRGELTYQLSSGDRKL